MEVIPAIDLLGWPGRAPRARRLRRRHRVRRRPGRRRPPLGGRGCHAHPRRRPGRGSRGQAAAVGDGGGHRRRGWRPLPGGRRHPRRRPGCRGPGGGRRPRRPGQRPHQPTRHWAACSSSVTVRIASWPRWTFVMGAPWGMAGWPTPAVRTCCRWRRLSRRPACAGSRSRPSPAMAACGGTGRGTARAGPSGRAHRRHHRFGRRGQPGDIAALAGRGFEAAITGRALYEGAFSLPEALAAAAASADLGSRADG